MTERRSLTEGLQATPIIDRAIAREFIRSGTIASEGPTAAPEKKPAPASRSPISTRIRGDLAAALKRASLERQLSGVEPNTLQDILEQAIEPWLRANGYLS